MKILFKRSLAGEENHQSTQCNATHVVEFAMLLLLACTAVTGEPNKGKCSREVSSISFGNVQFGCFRNIWISDWMSHVWKCYSYNSDFCASRGQILSPRRKLSQMKKEKKNKTKKRKRNQNVVQQKANLNPHTHRAIFRMHGWVNLAGLCLTGKAKFVVWPCVCVCGFVKNRFQNIYPLEFLKRMKIPFKMPKQGWVHPLE